jgi:hypothetical protein
VLVLLGCCWVLLQYYGWGFFLIQTNGAHPQVRRLHPCLLVLLVRAVPQLLSGAASSVSLVLTPASVLNPSSVGTSEPADPPSPLSTLVGLSPYNKPLSRNHKLASSPCRFSFCNSCSFSSVLP